MGILVSCMGQRDLRRSSRSQCLPSTPPRIGRPCGVLVSIRKSTVTAASSKNSETYSDGILKHAAMEFCLKDPLEQRSMQVIVGGPLLLRHTWQGPRGNRINKSGIIAQV